MTAVRAADPPWPVLERTVPLPHAVDLVATLGPIRQGRRDPTASLAPGIAWRATRTPDGPAGQLVQSRSHGAEVLVRTWGPGAVWLLERADHLVSVHDDLEGFDASIHPVVHDLWRRHRGLRILRSDAAFEILVPTICAQKVTGIEAKRSWFAILRRWGEPAPRPMGPLGEAMPRLVVPPAPEALSRLPTSAFHRMGLEHKRASSVVLGAGAAGRIEAAGRTLPPAEARKRVEVVPGLGIWTSAEVSLVAWGDADAVSVGDYHLKNLASWALASEPRGTDDRMLELLEPFRGHRGRVLRLLTRFGMPPRRGPRMTLRGFEDQ